MIVSKFLIQETYKSNRLIYMYIHTGTSIVIKYDMFEHLTFFPAHGHNNNNMCLKYWILRSRSTEMECTRARVILYCIFMHYQ